MSKHKDADVMVNFASLRSAYDSTIETMNFPQVTTLQFFFLDKIVVLFFKNAEVIRFFVLFFILS